MEYCQHLYINTVCYQVLSAEQSAKGKGLLVDWLHISQLHYVMAQETHGASRSKWTSELESLCVTSSAKKSAEYSDRLSIQLIW